MQSAPGMGYTGGMDPFLSPRDSYRAHSPGDVVRVGYPHVDSSSPDAPQPVGLVVGVGYCVFRRITTYDVLVGGEVRELLSYEVSL